MLRGRRAGCSRPGASVKAQSRSSRGWARRRSEWWVERFPGTVRNGTLVLAHARDVAELNEFASRTEAFERIGRERIAALEPDLAERFGQALYFPKEAHLDPRAALAALASHLGERVRFGADVTPDLVA